MNSIGIRVSPKIVYYAICEYKQENDIFNIITNGNVVVPLSLDMPDKLSYIRNNMFSIINEYHVKIAGIRTIENNVQKISIDRAYIEGVIQELISNCSVEKYFAGNKCKIEHLLQIPLKDVSDILDGKNNYLNIPDWNKIKLEYRECLIYSFASFKL